MTLNLPVDAGCRLRIDFPSDMPISSDLTSISGLKGSLFNNVSEFHKISVNENYIEVDGCPKSTEPSKSPLIGKIFL